MHFLPRLELQIEKQNTHKWIDRERLDFIFFCQKKVCISLETNQAIKRHAKTEWRLGRTDVITCRIWHIDLKKWKPRELMEMWYKILLQNTKPKSQITLPRCTNDTNMKGTPRHIFVQASWAVPPFLASLEQNWNTFCENWNVEY